MIQSTWYAGAITAANTAKDGTGTVSKIFAGLPPSGSFLHKLVFRAVGSNIATVARVFLNNGGPSSDAFNNALIAELALPATTLDEAAAFAELELVLNLGIPAYHNINVVLGTAVAAGYVVSAFGEGPINSMYLAAFANRDLT